jgi:predicted nucleic acid-binding protein
MSSAPVVVLDTQGAIAYLHREPGGLVVEQTLSLAKTGRCRILLSAMSVCEIAYIVERRQGETKVRETLALLEQLPVEVVELDRRTILSAARIKAQHPISIGDAFVTALALDQEAAVMTGDPEFRRVEHLVAVSWLPQKDTGPAGRCAPAGPSDY